MNKKKEKRRKNNMNLDEDITIPLGLLPDYEIKRLAHGGMITPFIPHLVRELRVDGGSLSALRKVLSYGTGSFGYDLRLSQSEFKIFRHIPGTVINPKNFNSKNLEKAELHSDEYGDYFILPGRSYGLGVALELLDLPKDVTAIFIGKSTYARCGLIANVTPGEAGWRGHLTLEVSNSSEADCRIFVNEGIVQALFFRSHPCIVSYGDRSGKYQGQPEQIIISRV
jgi:dCTP deaminase